LSRPDAAEESGTNQPERHPHVEATEHAESHRDRGFSFAEMRHKVVETSTNGYEDPLIDGFDHFDIRSETERPHTLDVRQWY